MPENVSRRATPRTAGLGFVHTTPEEAPWQVRHQHRLRDEVLLSPVAYAYRTVHGIGGLMRPKRLTISTDKSDHRF